MGQGFTNGLMSEATRLGFRIFLNSVACATATAMSSVIRVQDNSLLSTSTNVTKYQTKQGLAVGWNREKLTAEPGGKQMRIYLLAGFSDDLLGTHVGSKCHLVLYSQRPQRLRLQRDGDRRVGAVALAQHI